MLACALVYLKQMFFLLLACLLNRNKILMTRLILLCELFFGDSIENSRFYNAFTIFANNCGKFVESFMTYLSCSYALFSVEFCSQFRNCSFSFRLLYVLHLKVTQNVVVLMLEKAGNGDSNGHVATGGLIESSRGY